MTSNASYDQTTSGADVAKAYHDQVKGRNVLVTGVAPNGIGSAVLEALAAQSPNLVTVTGRSAEKVNAAIAEVKIKYPDSNIKSLILDLASMESVRKAAAEFNATPETLDILINNAGVMTIPERTLSADGIEMQFATNHIGHFLFTNLIMPKLIAAAKTSPRGATRIINVASYGHNGHPIRFSDWNWKGGEVPVEEHGSVEIFNFFHEKDTSFTGYTPFGAYGQSKTANVLFTVQLDKLLLEKYGILSLAIHPGLINSNLGRHITGNVLEEWQDVFTKMFFKSLDQGSSTSLVAALDPKLNEWNQGLSHYLADCQFETANPWAVNEEYAKKLWDLSEEIVGEKFEY
ncbi:hypothetical protein H072_6767 [Dactylellina haptotyla CBS 200.50]|uniref:Ketoreductase (KR) domain-containing protein n=1 Tax=Dactylellina haptotyla (strain CBS 200.50) TaxID=1284197 RepID=S8BJH3_DACHA|nr:hypothetical protein H072_6767 [Dactylellina haptotyla CBS 200.50]